MVRRPPMSFLDVFLADILHDPCFGRTDRGSWLADQHYFNPRSDAIDGSVHLSRKRHYCLSNTLPGVGRG